MPHSLAYEPCFLGQMHLIYQSAMHATRAAVYYLPHLDSPALRKRKLQIFVDDDGLPGGEFGDPDELSRHLEAETAHFVRIARPLYSRSLAPWCAVETLSVDWMRALAKALSVHFPLFKDEPYFEECFSHMVEERHAAEVTQAVLRA